MPAASAPPAPPVSTPAASYRLTTANATTAPAVLRDLVVTLLRTTGHKALVDAARICTSEAVTNVYRHTRARLVHVDVTVSARDVAVYVYDDQPRDLPVRPKASDEKGGLGLFIIDQYADAWGTRFHGGLVPTSKAVWFRLVEGGRGGGTETGPAGAETVLKPG